MKAKNEYKTLMWIKITEVFCSKNKWKNDGRKTSNKHRMIFFCFFLQKSFYLNQIYRKQDCPKEYRCIKMFPFFYFFFVLFFTFLFLKNDTKKWKMFWDSLLYGAIEMANRRPMQMLSWLLRGLQRRRPQTGVQNSWRVSLHCGLQKEKKKLIILFP